MATIKGRNIIIYNGSAAIAGQKSCTININYDVIEKSSPTSGKAKEFLLGRYDWSVRMQGLIPADGFSDFVLLAGTTLDIKVQNADSEGDGLKGSVLVPSATVGASVGSLASGTLTFKGTGPLEKIE